MTPSFTPINRAGVNGVGHGGVFRRRHMKLKKDNIRAISKGSIRKLARRGGIRRIQSTIYDDVRTVIKDRVWEVLRRVVAIIESDGARGSEGRKTVTTPDVVYALKTMGITLYGCEVFYTSKEINNRVRGTEQGELSDLD